MERDDGRSVFRLEYVPISSDSNSFANRFSSLSYVDPPSFNAQLTADTHHPESVPQKAFRRAGHTFPEYIVMGNLRLQQVRRRQGVRQPKVAGSRERPVERSRKRSVERSGEDVVFGWSMRRSPQSPIPSPIDSARRVTSIPGVSTPTSRGTPTAHWGVTGA